ncbi:MAG: 50S ribosomal protein L32 [Cyanobacteria bacterium MAG CAR3_bin_5]|nr:50S ribosomal protein L32 [Cyanobacteria bacterium MAG CAR4_bin_6]MCY4173140.1 50S ribosomal protein L32 [Cyanobacteria bacterium MAG CAR3_bin_5]MCY4236315.1 50S ribosomal protein L32 [Cyanobacteria bacterium MAG CAR2_bin_4]MCY4331173.1 50S ribosomal protein L32 [Cyanobacteria bacterium MAG CAR1_bin_15]
MAVPKKKTSNRKRNQRRATWNRKAHLAAQRAMSLGKAVLSGRAKGFHYPIDDDGDDEEES